ncbi:MAG: hypothetical protein F6K35_44990 [Okeania sp. SIO2H7]|nr:hypothetical protein [Okeania sp. SIO2H7]
MSNIESIAIEKFRANCPMELEGCSIERELVGTRVVMSIDCPSMDKCHQLWRDRHVLALKCLDLWLADQIILLYKGHRYGSTPLRQAAR